MKIHILFIGAIALFIAGCIDEPNFPNKPHIEFEMVSRTAIDQQDSFLITIFLQDGDGDIGFQEPDLTGCNLCDLESSNSCLFHPTWSLFLIDDRDNCLQIYQLPFIEEEGQYSAIEGTIQVLVTGVCCKDPTNPVFCPTTIDKDTVHYRMLLKDRAGNRSDTILIPPITLNCI